MWAHSKSGALSLEKKERIAGSEQPAVSAVLTIFSCEYNKSPLITCKNQVDFLFMVVIGLNSIRFKIWKAPYIYAALK